MITAFELGWLVGILDGEGTFRYQSNTCHVVVKMTDEDTMLRLADIYEKILGRPFELKSYDRAKENRQMIYQINLTGENARRIMRLVVRHMCYRRRQRIWQCLNGYVQAPHKINIASLFPNLKVVA